MCRLCNCIYIVYALNFRANRGTSETHGGNENSTTWALIELQGDLQSHSESPLAGQLVGDLHYTRAGAPVLIVGNHLMHGKEVQLEKPFAFLEKHASDVHGTEYRVKHIIMRKLLFKIRPKPMV